MAGYGITPDRESQLAQSLGRLEGTLKTFTNQVMTQLEQHDHALFGNSRPGLLTRVTALEIEKRVIDKLTFKQKAKHWTMGSIGFLLLYMTLQLFAHLLTGHYMEIPNLFH
jgi:hypothetical protein